jgi:hypothetical protein
MHMHSVLATAFGPFNARNGVQVTLTDCEPAVLRHMQETVALNAANPTADPWPTMTTSDDPDPHRTVGILGVGDQNGEVDVSGTAEDFSDFDPEDADECGDDETLEEFLGGRVGRKPSELSCWDYVSPGAGFHSWCCASLWVWDLWMSHASHVHVLALERHVRVRAFAETVFMRGEAKNILPRRAEWLVFGGTC